MFLHEIEVEAGGAGGLAALRRVSEALAERYGSEVRRWPHDKLGAGLALAAIARSRGAQGLVSAAGDLRAPGYDAIERHLRDRRCA